jgi:hypothetical protein
MALVSEELLRDRRLIRRRGGLAAADEQKLLDELPDVADKAEHVDAPGASPEGKAGPSDAPLD